MPQDQGIQIAVREVLAQHERLIGIGSGRSGADPFVVALARVHDGVVVTEETLSRNLTKPKIPDVCNAMGIRWINLMGFNPGPGLGLSIEARAEVPRTAAKYSNRRGRIRLSTAHSGRVT